MVAMAIEEVEAALVVDSQKNLHAKSVANMVIQPLTVGTGMIGCFLAQHLVLCFPLLGHMPISL